MPYIITLLIAVVLVVGFTLFQSNQSPIQPPAPIAISDTNLQNATYKDGVYTADATYRIPEFTFNPYKMSVSLTIANGVVTDSTIAYSNGAQSDRNAQRFEEAYKTKVVGQKLNSINLSRVGGASLTTDAFTTALGSIRTQATS